MISGLKYISSGISGAIVEHTPPMMLHPAKIVERNMGGKVSAIARYTIVIAEVVPNRVSRSAIKTIHS